MAGRGQDVPPQQIFPHQVTCVGQNHRRSAGIAVVYIMLRVFILIFTASMKYDTFLMLKFRELILQGGKPS